MYLNHHKANNAGAGIKAEGAFGYLGEDLMIEIVAQIVAAIFERPGLSRSNGLAGELQSFRDESKPEAPRCFVNLDLSISEWPSSLTVFVSASDTTCRPCSDPPHSTTLCNQKHSIVRPT